MSKHTLTSADIDTLKEVFATKEDLKNLVTNDTLIKELEPIKKELQSIKKDTAEIINFIDKDLMKVSRRVKRLENHTGLQPFID